MNTYDHIKSAQNLDPLGLNDFFSQDFADLNATDDCAKLLEQARASVGVVFGIISGEPTEEVAQAALRDLDFIASALVRHGIAYQSVIGLENAMLELGLHGHTVPRGTVYTYAIQNFKEKIRSFTGSESEEFFISSVKTAGQKMLSVCDVLFDIQPRKDNTDLISSNLAICTDEFADVVKCMVGVSREVSPEFFTLQMRPYFEPMTINGDEYGGPGGAQLPLVVIDNLLWGSSISDESYLSYFRDNIRFQPQVLQQTLVDALNEAYSGDSLMQGLKKREEDGDDVRDALDQLSGLLVQIKRFRKPHQKVAKDNFKLRPDKSLGSGQYSQAILQSLIDQTDAAQATAKRPLGVELVT